MSVRRLHPDQPATFDFTAENLAWAEATIAKYPPGKQASAVIPLLWRAQEQHDNWLPEPAIRYVADMLDMAYIRVYEIATFYTMFQLSPVGKRAHVQVCGTTPCSTGPVDIAGLDSGVASVAAGRYHACALMQTGGVRCWGVNMYGQLGDGTISNRASSVLITSAGSVGSPPGTTSCENHRY